MEFVCRKCWSEYWIVYVVCFLVKLVVFEIVVVYFVYAYQLRVVRKCAEQECSQCCACVREY